MTRSIPYESISPKMRTALRKLVEQAAGRRAPLDFDLTVGRPTKQRLARFGLAEYVSDPRTSPEAWDGPMRITAAGRAKLEL